LRKIEAQLSFYYGWTLREVKALSEAEICEAWQNLIWVREQEAKKQKQENGRKF
jgi:hypothetical protein